MQHRLLLAILAALAAGSGACASQPTPRPAGGAASAAAGSDRLPPASAEAPTLVVFITVDQMRADYFDRWKPQLTGGLGRLYGGGAVMTNAFQDHANTETAPGHASTMSGRFPSHTGIVRNSAGVEDAKSPLLEAAGPGASPFRFRGTTLFDWLRARDPRARALSVSRKDRGAILPIGRAPQDVYWYASNGKFTTSSWYRDTLPAWVRRLNDRRVPQSWAGKTWTPLLPDSAYREPDSVAVESQGRDFVFPHAAPSDPEAMAQALPAFPWMDQLTLDFALEGVRALGLGAGPQTDLLAVSLSTTDAIGHRFGPDSREIHDQIVRLDRMLGTFLDSLFKMRDSARVVIALTADHGVAPFPELHAARDGGTATKVDLAPLARTYYQALAARGVDTSAYSLDDGVLYLDRAVLARAKLDADSVARAFAADARRVPGVARADLVASLARDDTVRDAVARRWYHALPSDLDAMVTVTPVPYAVWAGATYAQHGGPYDYDAHVPVLFYGRPFKPGRYADFARVVDMAPTLARVAGVKPTERLDGVVLRQVLR